MQRSGKPWHKLTDSLLFLVVTAVFLLVFAVTFKGFNGTDDMHYSLLAARLLQHRYSPFVPMDVFCGRVGVIAVQAAIYRIGGVNVLTTETGTLACTILCCWLTIFKLARPCYPVKTVVTATLFYFAPTLVPAIQGIMPDAYVMLIGVLLFLLWRKNFDTADRRRQMTGAAAFGTIAAVGLLFKESAVVLVPVFVFLSIRYFRKQGLTFVFPMLIAFACTVTVFGLAYYRFTGDFFFRVTQIHNSQLIESRSPGSCNCRLDPSRLLERLTYGPWKAFILQGFLPALLPLLYLVLRCITAGSKRFSFTVEELFFLTLLFTILYFPASLQQYQPVCSDARQYLMLMPFGIAVIAEPLALLFTGRNITGKSRLLLPVASVLLLCLIIGLSLNKWKWLTYGFLVAALFIPVLVRRSRGLLSALCLLVLMAATGLERRFFFTDPWFNDLRTLQQVTGYRPVYFPDHDNYIHWQFFCGYHYDKIYNLQPDPPPVYEYYYSRLKNFEPGWFILDRGYTICSPAFIAAVDQLDQHHFFAARESRGAVTAFQIDSAAQLEKLRMLLQQGSRHGGY